MDILHIIKNFNKANFTDRQYWVACHEAAHFVAAIHYRFGIFSVTLWKNSSKSGLLGQVHIDHDVTLGDLVITAAGPAADFKMLSKTELSNDIGHKNELERIIKDTKAAFCNIYHELYIDDSEPSTEQIRATLKKVSNEATILVNKNWDIIEIVAKLFLSNRNKKGQIPLTKLKKIKTITKELLEEKTI